MMKTTCTLIWLCAVAMVILAGKAKPGSNKEALKKQCHDGVTVSWSPCTADAQGKKMTTMTMNPPAGVAGCTAKTKTVECVTVKSSKKGLCTLEKRKDYTDCANGSPTAKIRLTITKTCAKAKAITKSKEMDCNKSKGTGKPEKAESKKKGGCRYSNGEWSGCDALTNVKTMTKTLKAGNPKVCPTTTVKEKMCKRKHKRLKDICTYKKSGQWSECDIGNGTKSRNMTLKRGDSMVCSLTKLVVKPCGQGSNGRRKIRKDCKYDKNQWGPCEAATNTVSRTLTLTAGDPTICNSTKIETRKCKDRHLRPHVCKYRRTTWGECHPTRNVRVMVKTLKRGDPSHCEPTMSVEKKCKKKAKADVCKYKTEAWSECQVATNTMTRRQVLKSGPSTCLPSKDFSRQCKKPCKYEKQDWSECDLETNQMTKKEPLKTGNPDICPAMRVLTKKCVQKSKRCAYDSGTWSDCDNSKQPRRTHTQKLVSGGSSCKQVKISTKSCQKKNGEDRCFFGPWGEYDQCQNGVQKKIRQVLQGGLECERKSVNMKAC